MVPTQCKAEKIKNLTPSQSQYTEATNAHHGGSQAQSPLRTRIPTVGLDRSLSSEGRRVFRHHVQRVDYSTVSLLMPKQVVSPGKPSLLERAARPIAEKCMFCRLMDLLVSSEVLGCDKASAADGTKLCLRTVPARMVASTCQRYSFSEVSARRSTTYSLSALEGNTLPQASQDKPADDPAREWDALRFLIPGGAIGGCAKPPKFVRSDTL
jgi:hypothetical protein